MGIVQFAAPNLYVNFFANLLHVNVTVSIFTVRQCLHMVQDKDY